MCYKWSFLLADLTCPKNKNVQPRFPRNYLWMGVISGPVPPRPPPQWRQTHSYVGYTQPAFFPASREAALTFNYSQPVVVAPWKGDVDVSDYNDRGQCRHWTGTKEPLNDRSRNRWKQIDGNNGDIWKQLNGEASLIYEICEIIFYE
jgi:hypothetical protein